MMLDILWKISLQATFLAAVVWLTSRLARRSPARLRHALWVIVLVKFLVPPSVQFPSQLAFWLHAHHVQTTRIASYGARIPVEPIVSQIAPVPAASSGQPEATGEISRAPKARVPSVAAMITMGWAIGVFLMFARLMFIRGKQAGLLSDAEPGDERMQGLLSDAASALGVRRLPSLMVSPNVSTPMLAGLLRPTIYLPPRIAEACGETDARAILLHELAHIKRMDMAVAWLYQIVDALFFFHPALWLAGRELAIERELACDEFVVTASAISPADYAAGYVTALRFANGVAGPRLSLGMAEPFSIGKRRLELMLQESRPRMTRSWAAALLVTALIGLPTFAGVHEAETGRRPPATLNAVSAIQSGRGTTVYRESSGQYHTIGSPADQPEAQPATTVSPKPAKPANEPKPKETAKPSPLPCRGRIGTRFGYRIHPRPTKPAQEPEPKETAESPPLPCAGRIGTRFGYRIHPITHVYKLHTGVDIIAPAGTPVRAVADGDVIVADWKGAYGNAVMIDQGKGISTLYGHCSKLVVSPGQNVHRGDVIAYVGSTGYSTGPQLHFEKRQNGVLVNPI